MKKRFLALAFLWLWAASVQAEWRAAVEVPWADHSDFRISYHEGRPWAEAELICVAGAYDFLLYGVVLTEPLRLFASMPRVEKARYRVDGGEWRELLHARYYAGSDPRRRYVAFPFTGTPMTRFMEGREAQFVVLDTEGNTHRQTVSLIGFTRAFNSLPQLDDCE